MVDRSRSVVAPDRRPPRRAGQPARGRTGTVSRSTTRSRWRYLAAAPALAMVIAGVTTTGGVAGGAQAKTAPIADSADSQDSYINYVAPKAEQSISGDKTVKGAKARSAKVQ